MTDLGAKVWNGIQKRSVQTLLVLGLYAIFASFLPVIAHQTLYTVSLFIKDLLIWMMPLTVCVFITHTVQSFERKAPLFILVLVVFEFISNFSAIWYASAFAHTAAEHLDSFDVTTLSANFKPLWRLPFIKPSWWSAEKGAMVGLVLGCTAAFYQGAILKRVTHQGKEIMQWLLTKVFSRLIPLFVLGFAAQMYQMKILWQLP